MRKTLLLTFFALIAFAAGAWAQLTQDANGYYLLGSVQDWKDFAEIVNSETNTAANAKMIADIDLGDDQTYISPTWRGDYSNRHYHGTFDGQGHTLTVHYNSSNLFHTPFSQTSGATIKNLHVAGTITSNWTNGASHISGLISNSAGSDVIQNVWVSVDISGGVGERLDWGAFVGCNNCGNTTITDCLFTGSITNTGTRNGCLAGLVYQGSVTTSNCLSTGTFNFDSSSSTVSVGTMTNCYIKTHPASIPSSMQVTDAQLSNGTTTAALQNGRSEEIWVQDPVTNQPILKTFVSLTQDANGYYKIGSVQDWKNFAEMVNSGTNPAANAKMTADINLGDDQTMIGDKNALTNYDDRYHYQGIFDGQGHTLTVAYVVTNTSYLCATFAKIKMATIKNLHVDGTMTSCGYHTAGVVSDSRSTARIENVWCSVAIVGTSGGHDHYSGIAGCLKTGGLTISDCLFTGSITTATSYTGHFIGYIDSGTATTTN
ncbi:MAG: hypothetical protein J6129_02640, partial [Bacteroidaceae bacterium]|nr:hypothetical protein [Bacteroidaceae bacterium]